MLAPLKRASRLSRHAQAAFGKANPDAQSATFVSFYSTRTGGAGVATLRWLACTQVGPMLAPMQGGHNRNSEQARGFSSSPTGGCYDDWAKQLPGEGGWQARALNRSQRHDVSNRHPALREWYDSHKPVKSSSSEHACPHCIGNKPEASGSLKEEVLSPLQRLRGWVFDTQSRLPGTQATTELIKDTLAAHINLVRQMHALTQEVQKAAPYHEPVARLQWPLLVGDRDSELEQLRKARTRMEQAMSHALVSSNSITSSSHSGVEAHKHARCPTCSGSGGQRGWWQSTAACKCGACKHCMQPAGACKCISKAAAAKQAALYCSCSHRQHLPAPQQPQQDKLLTEVTRAMSQLQSALRNDMHAVHAAMSHLHDKHSSSLAMTTEMHALSDIFTKQVGMLKEELRSLKNTLQQQQQQQQQQPEVNGGSKDTVASSTAASSAVSELQDQVHLLYDELANSTSSLEKRLLTLVDTVTSERIKTENLEDTQQTHFSELSSLTHEQRKTYTRLLNVEDQVDNILQRLKQMVAAKPELASTQQELKALTARLYDFQQEYKARMNNTPLLTALPQSDFASELKDLQKQLAALKDKARTDDYPLTLKMLHTMMDSRFKGAADKWQDMEERLASLEQEQGASSNGKPWASSDEETDGAHVEELEERLAGLETQLENTISKQAGFDTAKTLLGKIAALQDKLQTMTEQQNGMQSAVNRLQQKASGSNSSDENSDALLAGLQEQVERLDFDSYKLEGYGPAIANASKRAKEAQQQVLELQAAVNELKAKCDAATVPVHTEDAQGRLGELEKRLSEVETTLTVEDELVDLEDLCADVDNLREEMEELQQLSEDPRPERDDLNGLKKEFEGFKADHAKLQQNQNTLQKEFAGFRGSYAKLQDDHKVLQTAHRSLVSGLSDLKDLVKSGHIDADQLSQMFTASKAPAEQDARSQNTAGEKSAATWSKRVAAGAASWDLSSEWGPRFDAKVQGKPLVMSLDEYKEMHGIPKGIPTAVSDDEDVDPKAVHAFRGHTKSSAAGAQDFNAGMAKDTMHGGSLASIIKAAVMKYHEAGHGKPDSSKHRSVEDTVQVMLSYDGKFRRFVADTAASEGLDVVYLHQCIKQAYATAAAAERQSASSSKTAANSAFELPWLGKKAVSEHNKAVDKPLRMPAGYSKHQAAAARLLLGYLGVDVDQGFEMYVE